ncbi:uncharacterized protein [Aegilops tauschii subsp. strangulata]|uniref:uncharacterized protein n=1 Tax=Aegilops tauschii subsp. strangulata TaxID=200361 RepID=UPI00098AAE0D|nr:uncharacterized protein LOC123497605 [Aegilops tauschii subsp. strangulata]
MALSSLPLPYPSSASPSLPATPRPLGALLAGVADPLPCPRYVLLAQDSLRLFLGLGDADKLQLPEPGFASGSGSSEHLLCLSVSSTKLWFDELLASALLQSFIGGFADSFNVRLLHSQTFLFSVSHATLVTAILGLRPIHRRLFSLSFSPFLPPEPSPSALAVSSCKPLTDVLLLHHATATKFENAAWARLKSFVTVPSAPAPPACRLRVTFLQFPFAVSQQLCNLILACLFGGVPSQFHAAEEAEDEFSFSVANRGVADLVISFGALRRPGMDVHFSIPALPFSRSAPAAASSKPERRTLPQPGSLTSLPQSPVKTTLSKLAVIPSAALAVVVLAIVATSAPPTSP